MARTWLCVGGAATAKQLHDGAVSLVSAPAQAEAASLILPVLSDEELAVFKRGRNAHASAAPRGSTLEEYHAATGLEALFGYLYLDGREQRLDELFGLIVAARDAARDMGASAVAGTGDGDA
jgi:ribonuclease-3 family protein